jgi:hypothetical protein
MLAKLSDKLFRRNFKRFADSQQGEDGKWTSGFDHLPMTHAEAVRIHVLLAQLTFRSVRSNPMAQGAKESRIVGRKVSGGAHSFRVRQTRAKEPRARLRFVCYMRRKAMGHSPPALWCSVPMFWFPLDRIAHRRRARRREGSRRVVLIARSSRGDGDRPCGRESGRD